MKICHLKTMIVKFVSVFLIFSQFLLIAPTFTFAENIDEPSETADLEILESDGFVKPSDPNQIAGLIDYNGEMDEGEEPIEDNITEFYEGDPPSPKTFNESPDSFPSTNKIELNTSDRRDLEKMVIINSVLPELRAEIEILSELSGKSIDQIKEMTYTELNTLAETTADTYFTLEYIVQRLSLIDNASKLAELIGVSELEAKNMVANREKNQENWQRVRLAINETLEIKIDSRVIETLNYLVRPKDDPRGGAGHWHIKVDRIRKNHTDEANKETNESDLAYNLEKSNKAKENQEEQRIDDYTSIKPEDDDSEEIESLFEKVGVQPEDSIMIGEVEDKDEDGNKSVSDFFVLDNDIEKNVSAHYYGQAIDISEVDDIKCTVIKRRRLLSNKREMRPPIPIKLLWQTDEGYNQDNTNVDSSINDMLQNTSQEGILDMLSEMNIDFENIEDMDAASFNDITSVIGQALFSQAINSSAGNIWKFDLSLILRKLGGVVLADKLSLPRQPFLDSGIDNINDLMEAVGRYDTERRINLPYGSFYGTTRGEIFTKIGKSKIISELRLPEGSLDVDLNNGDENKLMQLFGSRIIESEYALAKGSFFNKSDLGEVKDATGSLKINAILSNPNYIDLKFYLETGSTEKLKKGLISPDEYSKRIGQAYISARVYSYGYHPTGYIPFGGDMPFGGGMPENPDESKDIRDEAFNLPEGTISKLLSVSLSDNDIRNVGFNVIVNALEFNDQGREDLQIWLQNPNKELAFSDTTTVDGEEQTETVALNKRSYSTLLGLSKDEIYTILGSEKGTRGLFIRKGRKILCEAVKNSSEYKKTTQKLLRDNPELANNVETIEFVRLRIESLSTRKDKFKQRARELKDELSKYSSDDIDDQLKTDFEDGVSNFDNFLDNFQNLDSLDTIMEFTRDFSLSADILVGDFYQIQKSATDLENDTLNYKINAFLYELEQITKCIHEILSGQRQDEFRLGDVSISDLSSASVIDLGSTSLGYQDIILIISGKISIEKALISIGSAKLGDQLGLPLKTLQFAAEVIDNYVDNNNKTKDAFFRAIGISMLENKAGKNTSGGNILKDSDVGNNKNIKEIRNKMMEYGDLSRREANKVLSKALNLEDYNLESLMSKNAGAWMAARDDALKNDAKYKIPAGTTEKFVKSESIGDFDQSSLSDNEIREFSAKSGISETAIKLFIATRDGQENLAVNSIYFVDRNPYQQYQTRENVCVQKEIPDNSYLYYDADGMHTFNSYSSANEYKKDHSDKEINFKQEFISSLTRMINDSSETIADPLADPTTAAPPITYRTNYNPDNLSSDIDKFLSGELEQLFPDTGEDQYEKTYTFNVDNLISGKFNINPDIFNKIFSHNSASNKENSIDFLKILGFHTLKYSSIYILGDFLNLDIGSVKVTPDDLFNLFTGKSEDFFSRIGGETLGRELGLNRGTVADIVQASNSSQVRCAMENAAFEMLGESMGIKDLKIYGNSFSDNFGRGKVERFLSLPDGSFRGDNLDQLLSGLPINAFYTAFQYPVSYQADQAADKALVALGEQYFKSYKNRDIYYKINIIYDYIHFLDPAEINSLENDLFGAYDELDSLLNTGYKFVAKYQNNWVDEGNIPKIHDTKEFANYTESEFTNIWKRFVFRVSSIDTGLSLDEGDTLLLMEDRLSPNNYASKIENETLTDLSFEVLTNYLGLESGSITKDDINDLKNNLRNDRFGDVYSYLDEVFSINFDQKAGFKKGTISNLLNNPDKTIPFLLDQGARRLDQSLGTVNENGEPLTGKSLTTYVNVLMADPSENEEYCNKEASTLGLSFSECMDLRTSSPQNILKEATNAAVAIRSKIELEKITGLDIMLTDIEGEDNRSFRRTQIGLKTDDIVDLFRKGDLRPLELIGTAYGLKQLIVEDHVDRQSYYRMMINYKDIYRFYYGNKELESYARQRAYASASEELYGEVDHQIDPDTRLEIGDDGSVEIIERNSNFNIIPFDNYDNGGMNSKNNLIFIDQDQDGHLDIDDQAITMVDLEYPVSSESFYGDLGPKPNPVDYNLPADIPDGFGQFSSSDDFQRYQSDLANWKTVRDAGEKAVGKLNSAYSKNFEVKAADLALYKLDSRIPAGFYWSMMEGNGYAKTVSFIAYFENILRDNGTLDFLPEQFSLVKVYDYIKADSSQRPALKQQLQDLGVFGALDDVLMEHSFDIFGFEFTFEPGTTKALFDLIKDGSIDSLEQVYVDSGWFKKKMFRFADEKLGLPLGTSREIYEHYKNMKSAIHFNKVANQSLAAFKTTEVFTKTKKAMQSAENARAAAAGSTPETVSDTAVQNAVKKSAKQRLGEQKASLISFAINLIFAKQLAKFDENTGLAPGSSALIVTIIVALLCNPEPVITKMIAFYMLIIINLFCYYKVDVYCSANGSYPKFDELKVDYSRWDAPGFRDFNALEEKTKKENFVKSAQYKADQLINDLYEMESRTGIEDLVPRQIMTGREEDVQANKLLVKYILCPLVTAGENLEKNSGGIETGICEGSRAGLWSNPQTIGHTHIGF